MTRTFYTSDLHFGHANIIRYCGRPFADVDEMNDELVRRWNETVTPDDTVWVLGDVAMGSIHEGLSHVGRLQGHKILLTGNHDRCWPHFSKRWEQWLDVYEDAGFEEIHHGTVAATIDGLDVQLSHFPFESDAKDERHHDLHPRDDGQWLIHGHVHELWRQNGRMINVGCDAHDFRPVSEALIAEMMRDPAETSGFR